MEDEKGKGQNKVKKSVAGENGKGGGYDVDCLKAP